MEEFHKTLKSEIKGKCVSNCQSGVEPRKTCTICKNWKKSIMEKHKNYSVKKVNLPWSNVDPQFWPTEKWEVAKMYMPKGQKPGKYDPDISSAVNFMIFCKIFYPNDQEHKNNSELEAVRNVRNNTMHSENLKVEDQDLSDNLGKIITMFDKLEDDGHDVKSNKELVEELKTFKFEVNAAGLILSSSSKLSKVDLMQQELNLFSQRYRALEEEYSSNQNKFKDFLMKYEDLKVKFKDEITEIKKQLTNLKGDFTDLKGRVDTVEKNHAQDEEKIPPEIIARGKAAMNSYKHEVESGKTKMVNSRIMVLGKEGVGKTSCVKAMLGKSIDENEPPTDGIVTTTFFQTDDEDCKWEERENDVSKLIEEIRELIIAENISETLKTNENQDNDSDESETIKSTVSAAVIPDDLPSTSESTVSSMRELNDSSKNENTDTTEEERSGILKKLWDELKPHIDTATLTSERKQTIPEGIRLKLEEILKSDLKSNTINPKDLTCVMDYAGHLIYYISHRVFLKNGSVYFVVFSLVDKLHDRAHPRNYQNGKEDEPFNMTNLQMIVFWIRSIYEYAILPYESDEKTVLEGGIASPPICLVGTHKDLMTGSEEDKEKEINTMCETILAAIKGMPYEEHVEGKIHAIDNSNNTDAAIKILKSTAVSYMKAMSTEVPISWLDFQAKLLKDSEKKLTMPIDEVNAIAADCGVLEIDTSLDYMNDIGMVLCSKSNEKLMKNVITNLPMMIEMLRKIITFVKSKAPRILVKSVDKFHSTGILDKQLLDHFWENELQENRTTCLEIMKMFNLLFERKDEQGNSVFLVPSQMKVTTESLEVKKDDEQTISVYVTPTDFLPDSVYNVLIVSLLDEMKLRGRDTKSKYVKLFRNRSEFDLYDDHLVSLGTVVIANRHALKLQISSVPLDDVKCEPQRNVCLEMLACLRKQLKTYGSMENVGYELCVLCDKCQPETVSDLHKLSDCLRKDSIRCGNKRTTTSRFKCLFTPGKRNQEAVVDYGDGAISCPTKRLKTDDNGFYEFLLKLSEEYRGTECKWLKFLLFDHLPKDVLSHNFGFILFKELFKTGHISCTNVTILSEIAQQTNYVAAQRCVEDYQESRQSSSGPVGEGLPQYRKLIFKALRDLAQEDVKQIETFYSLNAYRYEDIWDIVFHLELKEFLDDKKPKWNRFAELVTRDPMLLQEVKVAIQHIDDKPQN